MKAKIILIIIGLAVTFSYVFSQYEILNYLRAESQQDKIVVTWSSKDESNVQSYIIERSKNNSYFKKITTVDAKGSSSEYRYVDEEVFMKAGESDQIQEEGNYSYRLKIVKSNDALNQYSDVVSVSHSPSSVRRTWGMIKEMFR